MNATAPRPGADADADASAAVAALRAPGIARIALAVLALTALSIGLPASFAPQSFYDDYPFVASWVSLLPPYNEHLVTDVGGLYLGFAVVLAWAAWRLSRDLVHAVCAGWALMSLLHVVFHARNLERFSTGDAIGEITALVAVLLLPGLAAWAVGRR